MALTFFSLGSNIGDRMAYLRKALVKMESIIGIIIERSDVYETQSWGFQGLNFLNMVVKVDTALLPQEILHAIQTIEAELGRNRLEGPYVNRFIDLDILFYGEIILNTERLTIPHPHIAKRLFVLIPLMDIEPDFIHPVVHRSIRQLTETCPDKGWIKKYEEN